MIHDVAVAIRRMQRDDKIRTAMTVDCDVHQGNGTAAIFAGTRIPSDPLSVGLGLRPLNPARPAQDAQRARRGRLHDLSPPGEQLSGVQAAFFD